ncbi:MULTISPECIES: pilus assembly PilX family protein [Methylomicrobium]|uniref:Type 4 fimbrial biogenesis protein PilX N-terminal domain-containing protein n=1 Tax=Methylomicrobium album BG8 TaxID=686340 RepID=H8GK25_METAL|nr:MULTISPECIES: PilX N-terminal domain-containing pilus assembly protein [Methylomicrobium]EIC29149.1 hypothetical protein Metal_1361 [Methylomicrobium album BG8]
MKFPNRNPKARQRGAVTLIVALMLAIVMAVVSVTTARTGLMEQKITGNDLRAREAQEAAEAGLEYGVAWAQKNTIPNAVTCSSGSLPTGCPTALSMVTGSSTGESYSFTLTFTKKIIANKTYIKVESSAEGVNDSTIAAISEAWVTQTNYLTIKGQAAPPFVINGSLANVTGNPDIDSGSPPGTAIITSQPVSAIDTGFFNKHPPPSLGSVVSDNTFPGTSTPAWDYLFTVTLSTATHIAMTNEYNYPAHSLPATPGEEKEPFYVWDSDSHISGNFGSATRPVVIIIQNGRCPKIQGNVTIYGFVYFSATCSDQGWGNATIHGTIVSEGNITKVTANSKHIGNGIGGGGNDVSSFIEDATRIPGTWKDF